MRNMTSYLMSLLCALTLAACTLEDEHALVSRAEPAALATSASAASNTVSASDDCATVAAWVSANTEALPTGYEAFVEFPMNYRKAIFNALPAEQKSMLWQQHLSRYLASHPEFSATQVEIVQRAMILTSADLYLAPDGDTKRHEALEALREAAEDAFGTQEAQLILATLGPGEPKGSSGAALLVDCDCSTYSDWCAWWNDCAFGGCDWSYDGCGTGWDYPCNGVCR